jgi:RNA polymerase sigma-B factor
MRTGTEILPLGLTRPTDRGEEERELFLRYQRDDDVEARDELIERFLPLARQIAGRYRRGRDSFDDLLQVASIGLIKAVDRFDPQYGTSFMTFAVPSIAGELKRYFRDAGWAVRVPRPVQERALKVNSAVERLQRQLGHSPTPKQVAEAIGEDVESVLEAMEAATAHSSVSLDRPLTNDGDGEGARYEDMVGEIDARFEVVEDRASIAPAIESLPERDRLILKLRFEDDRTQAEIAEVVGISQMHVSRLLRRALERLRSVTEGAE